MIYLIPFIQLKYIWQQQKMVTNKKFIAHLLFILLFVVVLRLPTLQISVIDWDETAYALVAREIFAGNWPYSTAFEHKPISIYIHFAAFMSVFGDNPTATRLVSFVAVSVSSIILKLILQVQLNQSAKVSTCFSIFFILASFGLGGAASNSEHIVNVYILAAILTSLKAIKGSAKTFLFTGFFLGIAFQTNYLSLFIILGFLFGVSWYFFSSISERKMAFAKLWPAVLYATLGFLFSVTGLLLPIYLWGDIGQYFNLQIMFLTNYRPSQTNFSTLYSIITILFPFFLVFVFIGYKLYTRKSVFLKDLKISTSWFMGSILIGSFIAACASGKYFLHYFILILPTLFITIASIMRFNVFSKDSIKLIFIILLGTSSLLATKGMIHTVKGAIDYSLVILGKQIKYDIPRIIANEVRPFVPEDGSIYVVCEQPVIYHLLKITPPTLFGFYIFHINEKYANAFGFTVRNKIIEILDKEIDIVVLGALDKCPSIKRSDWEWFKEYLSATGYIEVSKLHGTIIYARHNV